MGNMGDWGQFGLAGMVIGALFLTIWAIGKNIVMKLIETHQAERKEWLDSFMEVSKQNDIRFQETNAVIRELTNVVQSMKRDPNTRSRADD